MNSAWSNVKLRGQMISEFDEFATRKADETRNRMKLESSDSKLESKRYPCLKINENPSLKLGKNMNLTTSTI